MLNSNMLDSNRNSNPIWSPAACFNALNTTTHMNRFRLYVELEEEIFLGTYENLYQWSINNISTFWERVVEYCRINFSTPPNQILQHDVCISDIPKWFIGAKLNYAENILCKRSTSNERTAMIDCDELGNVKRISDYQLYESVRSCSRALRSLGVQSGDRVAGYLPNTSKSVIIYLAAASIGAIWTCASPDFGVDSCFERFSQTKPKVLFSVSKVYYNGKTRPLKDKVISIAQRLQLHGLQRVIFIDNHVDYMDDIINNNNINNNNNIINNINTQIEGIRVSDIDNNIDNNIDINIDINIDNIDIIPTWTSFIALDDGKPIEYEKLPFDHPLCILYSSGTTGKPKCIVHSAGGILIQHAKEHIIHGNVGDKDIFFYYTTTGWMMWNWLVSTLMTGCTIVLYDGNPCKPRPDILWNLAENLGITVFGVSAKYLQNTRESHIVPRSLGSFAQLRMILSTGSPLAPEYYDFIYNNVKENLVLGSITGGTDICSLFAGHNTDLPVYRGKIQCRTLGMAVEAWDDNGNSVTDVPGDLVCVKPFPAMPVYFWNDEGNVLYKNAYFSTFTKPVWAHGDYVSICSKTGSVMMLGRSDGTLNPCGVRFGSAELYNVLNDFEELEDTLAVGQKWNGDERVVLFCKMKDGYIFNGELVERIQNNIRGRLSARHVPAVILSTPEIPYTVNGKKIEVAVKKIISGQDVVASGTVANPKCLDYYRSLSLRMHKL